MKPKGTIFSRRFSTKAKGGMKISLSEKEKKYYKHARLIGAILFSFSITSLLFFYGPSLLLDLNFSETKMSNLPLPEVEAALTEPEATPQPEPTAEEEIAVNEFSIHIPVIGADSKVIYDVDPFDKEQYLNALKIGVAHASNSGLPGQGRRIFLFAHSTNSPLNFTKFNAVFYQLRLLEKGDEILTSLNNEKFAYKVVDKQIVDATDTHWLTEDSDKEQLVLQTCDPPGTTLRRLLIIAERV